MGIQRLNILKKIKKYTAYLHTLRSQQALITKLKYSTSESLLDLLLNHAGGNIDVLCFIMTDTNEQIQIIF